VLFFEESDMAARRMAGGAGDLSVQALYQNAILVAAICFGAGRFARGKKTGARR